MSSLIEAYKGELNRTRELLEIERERGVELDKLKLKMAELQVANEKLKSELEYTNDMLQSYRGELHRCMVG